MIGFFCYKKCDAQDERFGYDCHSTCPSKTSSILWGCAFNNIFDPIDCEANGLHNDPFMLGCIKDIEIGGFDVETGVCSGDKQMDTGLCYSKCGSSYIGVGPVCWGQTPDGWVDCGMGAAKDAATCATVLGSQVMAVGEAALFVGSMGSSSAVTSSSKLMQMFGKAKDAYKTFYANNKAKIDAAVQLKKVTTLTGQTLALSQYLDEHGENPDPVEITRAIAAMAAVLDPTGVSSIISAYTFNTCDKYRPPVDADVYEGVTTEGRGSNMCLDVDSMWKAQFRTCDGNYRQPWYYDMFTKQLKNKSSDGLCLYYGSAGINMNWCYDKLDDKKTQWTWNPSTKQLKSVYDGKCLDSGGSNGSVYASGCHTGSHMKWNIPYFYQITNDAHPGECIDVDSNWNLVMASCSDSAYSQFWRYDADSKQLISRRDGGLCMDYDATMDWGYNRKGDIQTHWTWDPVNKRIQSEYNTKKCIDAGTNNDLYLNDCHDGDHQKFNLYGVPVYA
jgi:Ricin-type beta-trefoil lectin domain